MIKILVTGGCGFIGSNFINYASHKNVELINLDRMDYCASYKNITTTKNYKFIQGDICDSALILSILKDNKIDIIVHFAAQTHVDKSFGNSIQFTKDNVLGTHNLLECSRTYGKLKKFIHISTDEVYGEVDMEHSGCSEKSILNPTNPYAATKGGAEFMVRAYHKSYNTPIVITRGNNVYGPHQYPDKLIPKFCEALLKGEEVTVHGDGKSRRNFIHVHDMVRAIWCVLQKGALGNIYNIGTNDEYNVLEIAKMIGNSMNIRPKIKFVEDRLFNDFRYSISTENIKKLGWKQTIPFNEGLASSIEWIKNNPHHWDVTVKQPLDPKIGLNAMPKMTWWIAGGKGWIGGQLISILEKYQQKIIISKNRIDDVELVEAELKHHRPDRVVCLIGRTHGENYNTIDYLEQKGKIYENIRDNLFAPLELARICTGLGIHMTYMGTGCIFKYGNSREYGFKESDKPNFFGSSYSVVKGFTDRMIRNHNALNVRIRMPITNIDHPRNFITKITTYDKICSMANSMTVLPELLNIMILLMNEKYVGTINLTNPGTISHNEILNMYKEIVDPTFTYKNFTYDEQMEILTSERSNNYLDTSFIESKYIVHPIKTAVRNMLQTWDKLKDIK